MTVKEQLAVLPPASVAVQVTVVVPAEKLVPEAGEQLTVKPPQRSLATGSGNSTTSEHCPSPAFFMMFAGQVIVGGCVSRIVTVKLHVCVGSVVVQVTEVVPTGKNEPETGEQVVVPHIPPVDTGG